jgi:glycosyltransferase involved in cell wall biosynthesis
VHTHLLRADLYGGLAARLAGVPVILTTQYAIFPYARAIKRGCDGLLDRMCRGLATDALCVSEAVRQDLTGRVGWSAIDTHTVRTGFDFDAFHPEPDARSRLRNRWSVPENSPLVMTVARLSREKGLETLLEAADAVRRKNSSVRFVLVGEGPLGETLAEQIRERHLQEHVRLAGFQPDIPSMLSAADVFVLPSYMEGMPNALLEAFAAGLPVIASAVGGLCEAIDSERTGLLVPARDPLALASAISRLLEDPLLARTIANAGTAAARERFSIDTVAGEYAALYTRLFACATSGTSGRSGMAARSQPWSRGASVS